MPSGTRANYIDTHSHPTDTSSADDRPDNESSTAHRTNSSAATWTTPTPIIALQIPAAAPPHRNLPISSTTSRPNNRVRVLGYMRLLGYVRLLGAAPSAFRGCGFRFNRPSTSRTSQNPANSEPFSAKNRASTNPCTGAAPLRPSLPSPVNFPSSAFSFFPFDFQLSTVDFLHTPTAAAYLTPFAINSSIFSTV